MSKLFSLIDKLNNIKNWIVIIICILFVGFLDANSLWERHYRWQRIKEMKAEIAELNASYDENTRQYEALKSDPHYVEKVAREKYYMTREGEDLFIIQHNDSLAAGKVVTDDEEDDNMPEV